jgi:signal transduction histidine kinase
MRQEKRKAEDQIQHSQQQLRLLVVHLQTLREKERATLAREMHDSMGNSLTSLKLDLTRIARRLSNPADDQMRAEIVERLKSASDLLDQTIDQVKTISTELRPGRPRQIRDWRQQIEWQCQEFERRTGIKLRLRFAGRASHAESRSRHCVFSHSPGSFDQCCQAFGCATR